MQLTARFRPHPRGFGFLEPVETEVDSADRVFVPPPMARGLIADDLVVATVSTDDKGVSADTITLRHRPRKMLVGTVARGPGRLVLEPEPSLASGWVRLDDAVADAVQQAIGRVIVVLLGDDGEGQVMARALVAGPFVAGSPQAIRARSTVVAVGRAAPDMIPGGAQAVGLDETDAAMTHARVVGLLASGRRGAAAGLSTDGPIPGAGIVPVDRTGDACVTIDDAGARDLDDAVAAHWDGADTRPVTVAVHIADPAATVGIDSDADRYARTVAATAYMAVGDNAPMLDPALAETDLSLLAGTERQVLSVRFAVAADGTVQDVAIEPARIVSRAQLSYGDVERWLADPAAADVAIDESDGVRSTLEAIAEAARRLGVERDGRLTFEQLFSSAAVRPSLVDGKLTVVAAEPHANAYRLIERLMVAANEAVAGTLVEAGVPALYRTHAGLDPEQLERIRQAVAQAGRHLPALDAAEPEPERLNAELLAAIDELAAAGRDADRDLLVAVATGSTARAAYDTDPGHHRGLAAGAYTHFTSPIRRYADLVVHRQLRAVLAGEPAPYDAEQLTALARWLDVRAGALQHLEARERGDLWARLLDRGYLDGPEPATVTGLTVNGLRIRLPRLGLGGFVTAERALGLPSGQRGQLVVDEHNLTTTSGPWRVGSRVSVRFVGLDDTGRPNWRLSDAAD